MSCNSTSFFSCKSLRLEAFRSEQTKAEYQWVKISSNLLTPQTCFFSKLFVHKLLRVRTVRNWSWLVASRLRVRKSCVCATGERKSLGRTAGANRKLRNFYSKCEWLLRTLTCKQSQNGSEITINPVQLIRFKVGQSLKNLFTSCFLLSIYCCELLLT